MRDTTWYFLMLSILTISFVFGGPASAQLWTLQDGGTVIQIEDELVYYPDVDSMESVGMSSWTVTDSADMLYRQWFWYSVGPGTAPKSLASLPVISSQPYTNEPLTSPLELTFIDSSEPPQFAVSVNYVPAGEGQGGGNSVVTKRVTIKNLTDAPLEFHFYHYSDFDVSYTPGTETTNWVHNDAGAIRGGKAYQTGFSGSESDGTTVVQITSLPASRMAVGSDGSYAAILDSPANILPSDDELYPGHYDFDDSFTGPYVEYDGTISPRDTQFGLQWDLSVAPTAEITFDIVDTALPSKPLVITGPTYSGSCTTPTEDVTYHICFANSSNPSLPLTNVTAEYYLGETTFVSASDGGVYDPATQKVRWSFGEVAADAPEMCVSVVGVSAHSRDMIQRAEIWSDQTFPAFRDDAVPACNHPPRFDSGAYIPKTAEEGNPYTYQIGAVDDDPDTALQYFVQSGPVGMTVSATGFVTWVPTREQGDKVEVTFLVSDGIASSTQTFTIAVTLKNLPPVVESLPVTSAMEAVEYRYQILGKDPEAGTVRYTVGSGPLGLKVDSTTGLVTWTPSLGSKGMYPVKINVADSVPNVTAHNFTIEVVPASINNPPVFESKPVQEVSENMPYSYLALARDPDEGDAVEYSLLNPPPGMRIVPQTGKIYWTPDYSQAGTHAVTVLATDLHKGVAAQTYDITVVNVDRPPVFSSSPLTAVRIDDSYAYAAMASDPDNKAIVKYGLAAAPAGMVINEATGLITWKPAVVEMVNVVVTAQDEDGGVGRQEFQVDVYDPAVENKPPVVTSVPSSAAIKEGDGYLYRIVASDPNGDLLTYTLAEGAPAGMRISKASGLLTWLTTHEHVGIWKVGVIVADGRGGSTNHEISIMVDNIPPRFTSTPLLVGNNASVYYYSATATDVGEAPVTISLSSSPSGMTINPQGVIAWPKPVVGQHNIVVRASDGRSTTDQSYTLTISHVNRPPVRTSGAPMTAIYEGTTYRYDVDASDPNDDPLTYKLDPGAPPGMTINAETGEIVWATNYTSVGTSPVTVRISDGSLETTESFNVIVLDLGPVFKSTALATGTVGTPYNYTAVAQDAGGGPITYAITSGAGAMTIHPTTGVVSWNVPVEGTYTVSISASDGRGSAVQSYTLKILGVNVSPVITSSVPTAAVNEGSVYGYDVSAADTNGDTLTYKLAAGAPAGMWIHPATGVISWRPTAADLGVVNVTVTVEDGRGGVASQNVAVTVANVAPVFGSTPILKWTPASPYAYAAVATDPGGAVVTYSLGTGGPSLMTIDKTTGVVSWGNPVPGVYTITVNASDGLATTAHVYMLTVADAGTNLKPVITTTSPPVVVNEGESYTYDVNASDANDDRVTYTLAAGSPAGMTISSATGVISWTSGYNSAGSYRITVRATDADGLFDELSYTLTVNDVDRAPTITSVAPTSAFEGWEYRYNVKAEEPDGDPLAFSLAKAPAGMSISADGVITWMPTVYQGGSHQVAIVVKGATLAATQTFIVKVTLLDSHLPEITSTPPTKATVGLEYGYQVVANDPDPGAVLTYDLLQAPEGMTISDTGLITWKSPAEGRHTVTFRVTDNTKYVASDSYTLVVTPGANVTPVIKSAPVETATAGELYRYVVVATDANGNALSYSLGAAPAGMTINSVGVISWTPPAPGQHLVKVVVSDGSSPVEQAYTLTVANPVNHPPVISSSAVTKATVGVPYSYQLQAIDPEGRAIQYSLVASPPAMTISSKGLISWTPSEVGAPIVQVAVADEAQSVTHSYSIAVSAGPNSRPQITSTAVTSATEGQPYSYVVTAIDPDAGESLTFRLIDAPAGMVIERGTGTIKWTPNYHEAGERRVTVRVQDKAGLHSDQTFMIIVASADEPSGGTVTEEEGAEGGGGDVPDGDTGSPNSVPVIKSLSLPAATARMKYSTTVSATDADADRLTFSLVAAPAGMTISPSGTISWIPTKGQRGTHKVAVTVSDGQAATTRTYRVKVKPRQRMMAGSRWIDVSDDRIVSGTVPKW